VGGHRLSRLTGQGSQNTAGSVISAGSTWPRFTAISLTPSVISCSYLAHACRAVLIHICPNVSCRGCEQGVVVGKLVPSFFSTAPASAMVRGRHLGSEFAAEPIYLGLLA
jgi:hypothetical protein